MSRAPHLPARRVSPPAFVIVGTARSGTTLVQRLVCELPGVVVPPETHLLSHLAPDLLRRHAFPLSGQELGVALHGYAALPVCRGLDLSVEAVIERLGGSCSSIFDLFAAVVAELAGSCERAGEKTPEHLLWWRPLTTVWPALRVIAVVRDPRAVVVSNLEVPFGMRSVEVLAERWRADQRALLEARATLGPDRLLVLRYEDVVSRPADARADMAVLLGTAAPPATRPGSSAGSGGSGRLYHEWETWKQSADEPVTAERVGRWRNVLRPAAADVVTAICSAEMPHFGYDRARLGAGATGAAVRLGPLPQARRLRYRQGRRHLERLVARAGP